MSPLSLVSVGDRLFVLELHRRVEELEALAAERETTGQHEAADDCWEAAAICEEELESALVELLDESGVSTTTQTEDDEAEDGFGESPYDRLLSVALHLHDRRDPYLRPEGVEPWPETPNAAWLGSRDMADLLVAGGRLWTRHRLDDLDDPRRPADSVQTCVSVRGKPCGPVQDVWEAGGEFVGPTTLLEMGAQPARTVEEVAARRLGETVRLQLRDLGALSDAVRALSDRAARDLVDDVWNDRIERLAAQRAWIANRPERPNNAAAWLAAHEEQRP